MIKIKDSFIISETVWYEKGEIEQGFPGTFLEKSGIATYECSKPGQASLHVVGRGNGR